MKIKTFALLYLIFFIFTSGSGPKGSLAPFNYDNMGNDWAALCYKGVE